MIRHFDIVIAGAGMAGASLASALAQSGSARGAGAMLIAEAEDRPGYHATGRSAAFWTESYGGPLVQPLTTQSGPFLRQHNFLTPRRALTIGRPAQERAIESFIDTFAGLGVRIDRLDRTAIAALVPGLRADWSIGALEPDCCDIDVAALHQHYLAQAGRGGAELRCRAGIVAAEYRSGRWLLTLADGSAATCDVLVNAAGAWADRLAGLAGVRPMGIRPLRRTMIQVRTKTEVPADLPLVLDIAEQFYFKPESGRVWLSPHDETSCDPCDAAPDELDVAMAMARFGQVVDWQVQHVERRWAGLRSFAPDRLPVYGFDPRRPAFFWFAGQGGFGIQTAPAAADLAARLICGEAGGAIDPAPYAPARFG